MDDAALWVCAAKSARSSCQPRAGRVHLPARVWPTVSSAGQCGDVRAEAVDWALKTTLLNKQHPTPAAAKAPRDGRLRARPRLLPMEVILHAGVSGSLDEGGPDSSAEPVR